MECRGDRGAPQGAEDQLVCRHAARPCGRLESLPSMLGLSRAGLAPPGPPLLCAAGGGGGGGGAPDAGAGRHGEQRRGAAHAAGRVRAAALLRRAPSCLPCGCTSPGCLGVHTPGDGRHHHPHPPLCPLPQLRAPGPHVLAVQAGGRRAGAAAPGAALRPCPARAAAAVPSGSPTLSSHAPRPCTPPRRRLWAGTCARRARAW